MLLLLSSLEEELLLLAPEELFSLIPEEFNEFNELIATELIETEPALLLIYIGSVEFIAGKSNTGLGIL